VLKRAVATVPTGGGTSKPRIPEPKPFDGARSFKELKKICGTWSSTLRWLGLGLTNR
jgi:hypothetical protein